MSSSLQHIPGTKDYRDRLTTHPRKQYTYRPLTAISKIAVHHSLTKSGSAESFARYHVNTNGWPGIGYHFVIDKLGVVKWCNDLEVKSYHVGKSNRHAVGICLVGDFREDVLEEIQLDPLRRLLKFLLRELGLTPDDVLGHNEFDGYAWKQCPCIDMEAIREESRNKPKPKVLPTSKEGLELYNPLTNLVSSFNPNEFMTRPGESVMTAANRFGLFDISDIKAKNKTTDLKKPQEKPVQIKVKGPDESVSRQVSEVIKALENKGHKVFKGDHKPYNLNIVGIRNANAQSNAFDDELRVFWKYDNKWTSKIFKATTDPGLAYRLNPINEAGTAILKEGQYRGTYKLGLHKRKYKALVQAKPVTVIRDFNRDSTLDFDSGKEQTGFFGINIHHASYTGTSIQVDKWSAGCQVFANINEYNEFIRLCTLATTEWGERFTYTLINKRDLTA